MASSPSVKRTAGGIIQDLADNPENSEIIHRILSKDPDMVMPPPPPFDIENLQRIEPPWPGNLQDPPPDLVLHDAPPSCDRSIPNDEPDLDWFNCSRNCSNPDPDGFD
jgi:hypothetical protein